MLFSSSVYSLLAAVVIGAAAAQDRTECLTVMTSRRPRAVQTQWTTHYAPCTKTSVITKYVTTTPTVKVTQTDYSTILITNKRTAATSTITEFQIVSTNTVVTTTSTSTSVVTVNTEAETLVPAPAAFVAIQSSIPFATFTNDTATPPLKRAVSSKARSLGISKRSSSMAYPQKVLCHRYTTSKQCAVKRVTTTSVVLAKPCTSTVRTSVIRTSVVAIAATATTKVTSVIAVTSTSFTQTSTVTTSTTINTVGTRTVYGVCLQTANYANRIENIPISSVEVQPEGRTFLEAVTVVSNAYQCCTAALRARGNLFDLVTAPQIFVFDRRRRGTTGAPQDSGGLCTIWGSDTCPASQIENLWGVSVDSSLTATDAARFTAGNAPCGLGVFAESDDEGGEEEDVGEGGEGGEGAPPQ